MVSSQPCASCTVPCNLLTTVPRFDFISLVSLFVWHNDKLHTTLLSYTTKASFHHGKLTKKKIARFCPTSRTQTHQRNVNVTTCLAMENKKFSEYFPSPHCGYQTVVYPRCSLSKLTPTSHVRAYTSTCLWVNQWFCPPG